MSEKIYTNEDATVIVWELTWSEYLHLSALIESTLGGWKDSKDSPLYVELRKLWKESEDFNTELGPSANANSEADMW